LLTFWVLLGIYLAALLANDLIIITVACDHHLHTPMYFFLLNFSLLDLGSISTTVTKAMANSLWNTRDISYLGCAAQVFLFSLLLGAECCLLTVISYDCYVAICKPLHYGTLLGSRTCAHMAAAAWANPQALLLTLLPQGSWTSHSYGILLFGCFVFIVVSYVHIFRAVLRIPSEQGQHKAFSTCLPHLAVVSLFLSTAMFAHLKPPSISSPVLDFAVLYSVVPPVMNPLIYSMRNKELKDSLQKLARWIVFH
ncbi:PREDICTED: olfactory receptor 14A16-like, partial [Tauraco erythrolophus]|uniref:olfactory receptor 14A16-like n=1 Tax=Tauraco erythrolophus TaxID=121530 RepID=UPI00052330D2